MDRGLSVKELRINFSLQRSDSKRAKEEAAVPQLVKTLIPLLNARSLHADYMISGEGNGAWLNADFVSDRSSYLFLTAPGHSHDVARVKDSKWIQVEELCSSAFIRRRWHDTCTGVEGPLGMVFHQVWSVITRCLVAAQQQVAVHSSLIQEVLPVPPPPPMPEIDQRTIAQSHERNPLALEQAEDFLCADRELVLTAVSMNGRCFPWGEKPRVPPALCKRLGTCHRE